MNSEDERKILNHDLYKNGFILYKKIIKDFLKKIPKVELITSLVEMKILKKDYLTKEISHGKKLKEISH